MAMNNRYIGQDDSGDAREKIEEMELLIEDNNERKAKTMEQILYIARKQENIRRSFYGLVSLLTGMDATNKPLHSMLEICSKEIKKLTERIGEGRVEFLVDQMEESGYKIDTEDDNDIFKVEEEQRRKKKEENENVEAVEDEEVKIYQKLCRLSRFVESLLRPSLIFPSPQVPTRASLRRQADIMLNAKDRGRGNLVKRK